MRKILVFGIAKGLGGVETFFHNYFKIINHKEYKFDFIAPEGDVAFGEEYTENGSKIFKVPFYSRHIFKYYNVVNSIIRKGNYDVVYVNMLSSANIIPF